jgi:hypothetical protein
MCPYQLDNIPASRTPPSIVSGWGFGVGVFREWAGRSLALRSVRNADTLHQIAEPRIAAQSVEQRKDLEVCQKRFALLK